MLKTFAATVAAVVVSLFSALCVANMRVTRFSGLAGERTFYLYSKSSQAVAKKSPRFWEWGQIRGESVVLSSEVTVESLLERYSAEVVFIERTEEVVCYYCYTPEWTDGVRLAEGFVNLHIAVGDGRQVVGAPVIFGGF